MTSVFRKIFPEKLLVDDNDQATNIKLLSFGRPHMRALHLSWICFLVAFTGWFSIPPLMPTIKSQIKFSPSELANANLTAVSATILARLCVGPLCDRFGPKRVMAGILLLGSIPVGLTGLIHDGPSLITLRFFIGILGATFVPCQAWATQMFAPSVVGTANALAGGWGNMGGGLTWLIMPLIYNAINTALPVNQAWRVTFIVPSCLCMLVAGAAYFLGDDCPTGDWKDHKARKAAKDAAQLEKLGFSPEEIERHGYPSSKASSLSGSFGKDEKDNGTGLVMPVGTPMMDVATLGPQPSMLVQFWQALANPNVLILMLQYACSFGLELAIDNMIGEFFHSRFNLSQTTSGMIGSVFGLMNIFSRLTGGILSDLVTARIGLGIQGRMLVQICLMIMEGLFLIGFSFGAKEMGSSVGLMICFSYFVQAVCGSTFSVVPFVNSKSRGAVYGLVGATGNLGGLLFNYLFSYYAQDYDSAFLVIGCIILGCGMLTFLLRVNGYMLLGLVFKGLNP